MNQQSKASIAHAGAAGEQGGDGVHRPAHEGMAGGGGQAGLAGVTLTDALAALTASQEQVKMLRDEVIETKTLLAASVHEYRPIKEYGEEILALNALLAATAPAVSPDTEEG